MKENFNNKNTLVFMLLVLLGLSILNLVLRPVLLGKYALLLPDYGEPFVTIILSLLLLFFAFKGDDRLFYLICGGWLIYFVISQIFSLPGEIISIAGVVQLGDVTGTIAVFLSLVGRVCVIVLGGLLIAFMKRGNAHNDAFNLVSLITILVFLSCVILSIYDMYSLGAPNYIFATLFGLTNIVMVFLFTYFVYDCAKAQLSKFQF